MNREMTYLYLAVKYPTFKDFFKSCYYEKNDEKMIDFLFALETTDMVAFQ